MTTRWLVSWIGIGHHWSMHGIQPALPGAHTHMLMDLDEASRSKMNSQELLAT